MEKSGYIVLDFETTGLLDSDPEVLQVSVINDKGETLLSGYCRPEHTESWERAQAVHGISPEMVANCPTFREGYLPKLLELIEGAAAVVAYNAAFERSILRCYGVEPAVAFIDPMLMFAEVWGDWNDYFQSYRWQTLQTARTYYSSLRNNPQTKFADISTLYPCRGSTQRFRIYINVEYYDEPKESCNNEPSEETALDLRTIHNAHVSAIRRRKA